MFLAFERYQLLLAAGALLGAVAWRILAKSIRVTVLFWMLAAASVPAALGPMLITSRMEKLRLNGQSSSPQFKKLHGESMIAYCGETIVLLAVGLTLPWAMRKKKIQWNDRHGMNHSKRPSGAAPPANPPRRRPLRAIRSRRM